MENVCFYWECNGDIYNFDSEKNYLIYYVGGFSPPHRGHFSMIEPFLHLKNVKIVISQIEHNRHGVSYKLNRKIWKFFLRELIPNHRNKVSLMKHCCKIHILDHKFMDDTDTIIYVRGNENYDIDEVEKKMFSNFSKVITELYCINKRIDFYYVERPYASSLSATRFIEAISKYRNKYEKLRYYLPYDLSNESVKYIIDNILNEIDENF